MKTKKWTVAQKAKALGISPDQLTSEPLDLPSESIRFAKRKAREEGMPVDVYVSLLLKRIILAVRKGTS